MNPCVVCGAPGAVFACAHNALAAAALSPPRLHALCDAHSADFADAVGGGLAPPHACLVCAARTGKVLPVLGGNVLPRGDVAVLAPPTLRERWDKEPPVPLRDALAVGGFACEPGMADAAAAMAAACSPCPILRLDGAAPLDHVLVFGATPDQWDAAYGEALSGSTPVLSAFVVDPGAEATDFAMLEMCVRHPRDVVRDRLLHFVLVDVLGGQVTPVGLAAWGLTWDVVLGFGREQAIAALRALRTALGEAWGRGALVGGATTLFPPCADPAVLAEYCFPGATFWAGAEPSVLETWVWAPGDWAAAGFTDDVLARLGLERTSGGCATPLASEMGKAPLFKVVFPEGSLVTLTEVRGDGGEYLVLGPPPPSKDDDPAMRAGLEDAFRLAADPLFMTVQETEPGTFEYTRPPDDVPGNEGEYFALGTPPRSKDDDPLLEAAQEAKPGACELARPSDEVSSNVVAVRVPPWMHRLKADDFVITKRPAGTTLSVFSEVSVPFGVIPGLAGVHAFDIASGGALASITEVVVDIVCEEAGEAPDGDDCVVYMKMAARAMLEQQGEIEALAMVLGCA